MLLKNLYTCSIRVQSQKSLNLTNQQVHLSDFKMYQQYGATNHIKGIVS